SPALFSLCVSSFTTPAPPELHPLSLHDALPIFPTAALIAYSATLVANTARITIALLLRQSSVEIGWLSPDQLHRFEGVFIYFGFLLLLFVVSEKMGSEKISDSLRPSLFPLLIYYAIALGVPLVTGA